MKNNLVQIEVKSLDNNSTERISLESIPNECPICHSKIQANYSNGFLKEIVHSPRRAQIIFVCPDRNCRNVFIGTYESYSPLRQSEFFLLKKVEPSKFEDISFSEIILDISPNFIKIYNQSHSAEKIGLKDICGAGYRKALEFLIKDYLISLKVEDKLEIIKESLGLVIENRVQHPKIKDISKRAVWLGNDETHYQRKWENKDVKDLKLLIDLVIRWIEMDKMSEEIILDMQK